MKTQRPGKTQRGCTTAALRSTDRRALRVAALRLQARLLELGTGAGVADATCGEVFWLGDLAGGRVDVAAWGSEGYWAGDVRASAWVAPGATPQRDLVEQAWADVLTTTGGQR